MMMLFPPKFLPFLTLRVWRALWVSVSAADLVLSVFEQLSDEGETAEQRGSISILTDELPPPQPHPLVSSPTHHFHVIFPAYLLAPVIWAPYKYLLQRMFLMQHCDTNSTVFPNHHKPFTLTTRDHPACLMTDSRPEQALTESWL